MFKKILDALLILSTAVFLVLIITRQTHQLDHGSLNTGATKSDNVASNAMLGTWATDGEAAWKIIIKMPKFAKAIAALTPEKIEHAKAFFMTNVGYGRIQFTANQIIYTKPGARLTAKYKITSIIGNTYSLDSITEKGMFIKSTVTVTGDRMEIFESAKPDEVVVFDRIR